METINDDDGKQLPKKEIGYRLFESSRWRTLEQGAPVAAKVNSQELWILSRVAKRWDSPGLTYKQIRDLSEIKKDAIFSEKVFIQGEKPVFLVAPLPALCLTCTPCLISLDHNEYTGDINNARAIARKNILPLPVSIAEGNKWGLRYVIVQEFEMLTVFCFSHQSIHYVKLAELAKAAEYTHYIQTPHLSIQAQS